MNMNLKKDSREIDGIQFFSQQFGAMRGFALFGRVVKTLGPALGVLAKLDPNTELDVGSLELASAFAALDVEEATRLVPEILAGTMATVDGRSEPLVTRESIDRVFTGRLPTLFKALLFALQVNFRDFLPGSDPSATPLPAPQGS